MVLRKIIFIYLIPIISFGQFMPSSVGVHHKKSSSVSDESYILDFDNDNTCTNNCELSSFYAQLTNVPDKTNWSVSLWIKSGANDKWRAAINSSSNNNYGWQIDSNSDGTEYRYTHNSNQIRFNYSNGGNNGNSITGNWDHLAVTSNGANGGETKLYYNGILLHTIGSGLTSNTFDEINLGRNRYGDKPGNYSIDEVRIWDVVLTEDQIQEWMFKALDNSHSNYSDLYVYFQMNSDVISGNQLLDQSGNNRNLTIYNLDESGIQLASSYVPVKALIPSYSNNQTGLWSGSGLGERLLIPGDPYKSLSSSGLEMQVSTALTKENFVIFGNNGTQSSSSTSILGLSKLSDREWQFDETGTVSADIIIDIGTATGYSGGASLTANNYKLLYKSCSMCDYSIEVDGASSVSNTDNITFSSVAINDGFYSIGSTDTNL